MTIPDVELQFPNSVLVFSRSRFSVCEVSGHPRETISPYESDSERGNKTAASERRKEGERDSNITNTNTERTAPKGILVRESEKEKVKFLVLLTSSLYGLAISN